VVVHLAACLLYYAAVQGGFDSKNTWVGAAEDLTQGKTTVEMWVMHGALQGLLAIAADYSNRSCCLLLLAAACCHML
jgi:hypothetical protein